MEQTTIFRARLLSAITAICLLLSAASAYAANPTSPGQAPRDQASTSSKFHGSFPVLLLKPLDSNKLKEGDMVVAQVAGTIHTASGIMIPSGTKIIGHVTQAQARSKGDPQSSLGIAFDTIELSKNEEIPIKGFLQAVGPSVGDTGPNVGVPTGGNMGSGHNGGGGGSPFTAPPPQAGTYGGYDRQTVTPLLTKDTKGVMGRKHLEMNDQHVITSTEKEIRLEQGTQMMVHVE